MTESRTTPFLIKAIAALLVTACVHIHAETSTPEYHILQAIDDARLANAFRFSPRLMTGGTPENEASFQALKELGVKTIISVDGDPPDTAIADKLGMRYVHLPVPYKEVPKDRALELAKAVRDLTPPIYMHCACGKLRSPAAAGVVQIILGEMAPVDAWKALAQAHAPGNYLRMYQCTQEFKPVDSKVLDEVSVTFTAKAPVARLTRNMSDMYRAFAKLEAAKKLNWKLGKAEAEAQIEASLLAIIDLSIECSPWDEINKDARERQMLNDCETELARMLRTWRKGHSSDEQTEAVDAAFSRLTKSCDACHDEYRNK